MDWELRKENFQPLRAGRDPRIITEATSSPAKSKQALAERRRNLWQDVTLYTGPDPLEPWLRLIKWTQDTFKTGGSQAELLEILERCTRELQNKENYKEDIRYLRVWLQYADCLPEPKDVFLFLIENNIGQDLALFYIAYAAYLELRGNHAKADTVFQSGLQKMALPVQKLQQKYDAFKQRMDRRRLLQFQEALEAGVGPSSNAEESGREVMGVLKSRGRDAGLSRLQGTAKGSAAGVAAARDLHTRGGDKENNSEGLAVFVDDEFQPGEQAEACRGVSNSAQTAGGWHKLDSFKSMRKENEQRPEKWKGNKLKQSRAAVWQPEAFLDVHEDEDLRNLQPQHFEGVKGALQQRAGGSFTRHIGEKLQQDPLSRFKDAERQAESSCRAHPPKEDVSFEEVRAALWLAEQEAEAPTEVEREINLHDEIEEKLLQSRDPVCSSPCHTPEIGSPESAPVPASLQRADARDVTVATQAAYASINGMFSGAVAHNFDWEGGAEPTATLKLVEPTVTLSSRAAFDAVNAMFQGDPPQEAPQGVIGLQRPCCDNNSRLSLPAQGTFGNKADGDAEEDQTSSFQIYEDTEFLPRRTQKSPGGDQTDTFVPYQDTEFLSHPPDRTSCLRDPTTKFTVYEDTEFL